MKLIIAIVKDNETDAVSNALTSAKYRVTTIASTSGFLRRGLSTLLCGLEDEQVENALQIIRQSFPPVENPNEKRCTMFVIHVNEYIHF
jgi:uncharacterized protein YaaQ